MLISFIHFHNSCSSGVGGVAALRLKITHKFQKSDSSAGFTPSKLNRYKLYTLHSSKSYHNSQLQANENQTDDRKIYLKNYLKHVLSQSDWSDTLVY